MKLVILGAGASYDAFHWYKDKNTFHHWRAPLSNEVFDSRPEFLKIIESYPGSTSLFSELGTVTDIEAYFQGRYELSKNPNAIEIEKKLINVKFFLQHLFSDISTKLNNAGLSNVIKLLSLIQDYVIKTNEDVLIVNFNYDLLIENALKNMYSNVTFAQMGDYLRNKIKLIKPHGSCNWHKAITANGIRRKNGESLSQAIFTGDYTQEKIDSLLQPAFYISPYNTQDVQISGQYHSLFPQIYIPLKSKDGFTMPKEQEDYLYEFLPKVDSILIVGWKGNESHFNNVLKKYIGDKKTIIEVVNGPEFKNANTVLTHLQNYINTRGGIQFSSGVSFNGLNLNMEILNFMQAYVTVGSLSSFLINIEQGQHKSIFNQTF